VAAKLPLFYLVTSYGKSKMKIPVCLGAMLLVCALVFDDCKYHPGAEDAADRRLVQKYCSACHQPVFPAMLDSATWIDHVLPAMAPKLGIGVWGKNEYYHNPRSKAAISFEEWSQLVSYYSRAAPEKLPVKDTMPLLNDWAVFRLRLPDWKDTLHIVNTSLVSIDTLQHVIYTGDATSNDLYRWDSALHPFLLRRLPSAPVDLRIMQDSIRKKAVLTCIGTIQALDIANGEVLPAGLSDEKDPVSAIAVALPRPLQAVPGDFDQDGLTDWVVCAFGHNQGGLYLLHQLSTGRYEKKAIREVPGAEQAVVGDFNHDGWPDIMALFAQADEGIWLFLNDHKGGFSSKRLLQFPPVYGSTSFQLADFNHDGKPDILYTCGDNADYSQILKPFHGLYIFLNQGNDRYRQAYFYPLNGCTRAVATDFDGDGDLDIAAIAFFADFGEDPIRTFVYLEQTSPLQFTAHAVPVSQYGRWIRMDVGDFDGDGYKDIVLGNYAQGLVIQKDIRTGWNKYLPFILLKNTGRHEQ
jgi:hypothetical protein